MQARAPLGARALVLSPGCCTVGYSCCCIFNCVSRAPQLPCPLPSAPCPSELLGQEVALAPDCVGEAVKAQIKGLQDGQILLLENVR